MKRKYLLLLLLFSGMAPAPSSSGSFAQQQPSPQQPPTQPQQQRQQQQAAPPNGSSDTPSEAGQTQMKGCLRQSGGNWVLVTDIGQSVNLSGDSSVFKTHDGRQVQVQGTRASDGSFQVSAVNLISDSCTSSR